MRGSSSANKNANMPLLKMKKRRIEKENESAAHDLSRHLRKINTAVAN
jgi:hypothetical protein